MISVLYWKVLVTLFSSICLGCSAAAAAGSDLCTSLLCRSGSGCYISLLGGGIYTTFLCGFGGKDKNLHSTILLEFEWFGRQFNVRLLLSLLFGKCHISNILLLPYHCFILICLIW